MNLRHILLGTLLASLFTQMGCQQEQPITVTTTGLGNNDDVNSRNDPSRAWIIAGVDNPEIEIGFSFRKFHPVTRSKLDIESISLNLDKSNIQLTETKNLYGLTFTTKEFSFDLPNPDTDNRRILKTYVAEASYNNEVEKNHSRIEVIRPFCEVITESEWKILGMTFETPRTNVPSDGWPTIILIHGGGRKSGDHTMMEQYAKKMLEHGFAVANINYSLININGQKKIRTLGTSWKSPLSDTKCAIRYLKQNADGLKLNADKIGVAGHSDGAILAIQAALTYGSGSLEHLELGTPLDLQGNHTRKDRSIETSVRAVFTMDLPADSELGYDILLDLGINSDSTIKALYGLNSIDKGRDLFGRRTHLWNESTRAAMSPANPKMLFLEWFKTGIDIPPLYMSFSNRLLENTPFKLDWYKHGCSLYEILPDNQLEKLYIDEYDIHHNEFITSPKITDLVANKMATFFGFFLNLEGYQAIDKTHTTTILSRCANTAN